MRHASDSLDYFRLHLEDSPQRQTFKLSHWHHSPLYHYSMIAFTAIVNYYREASLSIYERHLI